MKEKTKKIILMIAGPGILLFEAIALFLHLFTENDTKSWLVGGLIVFFVVFIPIYSIEYFKQNFRNDEKGRGSMKRKAKRTEWRGGNIHGKVPQQSDPPGRLFK
jgi:hypothetical protein